MASRAPIMGAPTRAPSIDRRSLFAAALIAPAVVAVPALAFNPAQEVTSALTSLIAKWRLAYAAHEKFCDEVSDPASNRRYGAVEAAKTSVPHVEMMEDVSELHGEAGKTKLYTTADRIHTVCAKVSAETKREDASRYTAAQHRHFAVMRQFHAASLKREAEIKAAVAAAEAQHDNSALIAQEDAYWAIVRGCEAAVIAHQPRTVSDLAAKLAFYAEAYALEQRDEMLESVMHDVSFLVQAAVH